MVEEASPPAPEAVIRRDHIANMLREDGVYSVTGSDHRLAYLSSPQSIRTQFVTDLALVGNILGAKGLSGIRSVLDNESLGTRHQAITHKRITDLFLTGDKKEGARTSRVKNWAQIADAFINKHLGKDNKVWEPLSQRTDLTEEVQSTDDVAELFRLIFKPGSPPRVRFEAKRKLVLMKLAASLDARSEELQERDRYPGIEDYFAKHIWHKEPTGPVNPRTGIRELEVQTRQIDILSKHDFKTYRNIGKPLELTTPEELEQARDRVRRHKPKKGGYFLRTTHFSQRAIHYKGELIPVNVDSREKPILARIGKMIRKGEEDPATAVQDTTGLMFVVRNRQDARKLLRHIASGGDNPANLIDIYDVEDTLDGGEYSADNEGSSSKTRQLKFKAKILGMSIEGIIHTYDSYLDYQYAEEIAHEEYEINRMLDSGAFQLLFPQSIYGMSPEGVRSLINYQRQVRRIPEPEVTTSS